MYRPVKRPASPRRTRSLRAVLHRATPAVAGLVVILVLGVVALRVGESNLRAAESDRLQARHNLVAGLRRNVGAALDPGTKERTVATTPFAPDASSPATEALLRQFQNTSSTGAFAALVGLDGHVLGAVPGGTTVDVGSLGPSWREGLAGRSSVTNGFRHDGEWFFATVIPVGGATPWAVLVTAEPATRSSGQSFYTQLGSMNGQPGGLVLLDRNGVAVQSWNPDEIGRSVLSPAGVAGLPADDARSFAVQRDGTEVTFVGAAVSPGFALVFEQETARLFGDLQQAQSQRNTTLLAVLAAAVAGLIAFQLAREVAARRAEARTNTLLTNSHDLVLVVAGTGTLSFVSPSIEKLLGQQPEAWRGRPLAVLCHPDDEADLCRVVDEPGARPARNVRLRGTGADYRWFDVEARDLRDHPDLGGILLTCHEVGDRRRLEEELDRQATHDALTGLPNRARFSERLEARLVDGHPTRHFALLYVDLDHFKPVNDRLGHDVGDQVLAVVADRLRGAAGRDGFVSRLGGDEFCVLLDDVETSHAMVVAEALLEVIRLPIAVGPSLTHLDASIGIAVAHPGLTLHSAEQLVRAADEAMYRAKEHGRGRYAMAVVPAPMSDGGPVPLTVVSAPASPATADPADGTTTPASAETRTDAAPFRLRRHRSVVPLLVAAAVVVGVGSLGYAQTVSERRAAEEQRLTERQRVTARAAAYYSAQNDPNRVAKGIANAPWTLDGGAGDQAVAAAFASSPASGAEASTVLATTDGRVLADFPRGLGLHIRTAGAVWQEAATGRPGFIPRVDDPDQPRSYYVIPVMRDGRPVAVVAIGLSLRAGPMQQGLERAGTSGYENGGWSLLDSNGVVYSSWDPALIGERFADRGTLAPLQVGEAGALDAPGSVLVVAAQGSTAEPVYLAFRVSAADFYRDLQVGQRERDLSLLILVVAAVAGLALVNHRREHALRRSESRLDALLHQANDIVVVFGDDDRLTFVSSGVERLLGYTPAWRVGRQVEDLVHPEDRAHLVGLFTRAYEEGRAAISDIRVRSASGDHRWFDLDAVDLRRSRDVRGVLVTAHEVTERHGFEAELRFRARHDALTGLPNRTELAERLEDLAAPDSLPFAVLFVDLDRFKAVNDTLGHDAGDRVLRIIAERFQGAVRSEGDGGVGDLVTRLSGDEFAIVLQNVTEAIARATADRLIEVAALPIPLGAHVVHIGATVGISLSHPQRENPDTTVRQADLAMYRAKGAGGGTYAFATDR
jgi:diguanylate cyclase (GGDEF)-like protein/PAS domain S-box-containing protein